MRPMEPSASQISELRAAYLFAAVPEDALRALLRSTRDLRLHTGEILFTQGQRAESFFFVRTGIVKLFRTSPEGGEKIIEIVRPGQTFAEAVMFLGNEGRYPVNAQALQDSELLAFAQQPFRELLTSSVEICFGMLASMSRRLHMLVNQIESLTLQNATDRLVTYLLAQIPRGVQTSPEIMLTTPKSAIAAHLAIQPETLSRLLKRLSDDGLIEVHGNHITLCNADALHALVHKPRPAGD